MGKRKSLKKTKNPGVQRVLGESELYQLRLKTKEVTTGKQIDKLVLCRGTELQAVRHRTELIEEARRGTATENAVPTVIGFVEHFIQMYSSSWKRSHKEFMGAAFGHLADSLGDVFIDQVKPQDVQSCLASIRSRSGGVAADSTLKNYLKRFRMLFELAVQEGLIERNPAHRMRVRAQRGRAARDSVALTPKQTRQLVEAAGEYDQYLDGLSGAPYMGHQVFIQLALVAGCRRGELTALLWEHIDLQKGWIDVVISHYRGTVDTTKTSRKDRIYLPDEMVASLGQHWRKQQTRGTERQREFGLVFPSRLGGHSSARLRRALPWCCERAGLPRLTTHDLRHTATTLWNQAASRHIAQLVIGHDDERTHDHYHHAYESDIREGSEKVAKLIWKGGGE